MKKSTKDIIIRAVKTFAQAFFGVLIPEVCYILENGLPENLSKLGACLAPVIASALASALSACWNIIGYSLKEQEEKLTETEQIITDKRLPIHGSSS